jgi:hypothetical protein
MQDPNLNPDPSSSQPAPASPAPPSAPPDPASAASPNTNPETTPPPSPPTAAPTATGTQPAADASAPSLRFGQLVSFKEEYPEERVRYALVAQVLTDPDAPDRVEVIWLGERSGPIHTTSFEVVEGS